MTNLEVIFKLLLHVLVGYHLGIILSYYLMERGWAL